MTARITLDLGPKSVKFPPKCITASALHGLAGMMDRLAAFHRDRGGQAPDAPCLLEVLVEADGLTARVSSGVQIFKLRLVNGGGWHFC